MPVTAERQPNDMYRIAAGEPEFPAVLGTISNPVRALWVQGRLPGADQPLLAIVGARAASTNGSDLARELGRAAVKLGYGVVSGGALGIDAAAHRGALDEGSSTFAVLGCGVDVVYPDRHGPLFAEIAAAGGLLSEYPPGTPPKATQFPVRNRIVAALAEAVIVVEAKFASGALVTARLALAMGRRLLAVPGSAGTEALLADGRARSVAGAADLRRALAGEPPPAREVPPSFAPLLAAVGGGAPRPALEVAQRLGVALPAALALISQAELDGWVRRRPGGKFEVMRDSE